jgi:hypothetical protein
MQGSDCDARYALARMESVRNRLGRAVEATEPRVSDRVCRLDFGGSSQQVESSRHSRPDRVV